MGWNPIKAIGSVASNVANNAQGAWDATLECRATINVRTQRQSG
jgi:hypothetical protein